MAKYYSSKDASALATEMGHTIGKHELSRQAKLGRVGIMIGGRWQFTKRQLTKFLVHDRRKRGRRLSNKPESQK